MITALDILAHRTTSAELAIRSQQYDIRHTVIMITAANGHHAALVIADFQDALNRCDTFHERQKLIRRWQLAMKRCEDIPDEC